MAIRANLPNSFKSPTLWGGVLAATCLITALVVLILGIHSVYFGHVSLHLHFYNTLATFNLSTTASYFAGAGILAGLAVFILKKIVQHHFKARLKQNHQERSFTEKAVTNTLSASNLLALPGTLLGILLVGAALIYIVHFLPQQPMLNGMGYLANEALLKALFAAIVIGGLLFTYGLLDTARNLSHHVNDEHISRSSAFG